MITGAQCHQLLQLILSLLILAMVGLQNNPLEHTDIIPEQSVVMCVHAIWCVSVSE